MRFWANLIGYQVVWFSAVIGAGNALVWPGVITALLFVTWQWSVSAQRHADAKLVAVALACGLLLDGGLASLGLARYAASWPVAWLAPAWILALWTAFALTINHSLRLLQDRLWLAFALGAIGGPMSYVAAEAGWAAVTLLPPVWHALLYLSLAWGAAMTLLACLARRWCRSAASRPAPLATEIG